MNPSRFARGLHGRFAVAMSSLVVLLFAAPLGAAVTGTIVDESGAPLAGATVRAFAQETTQQRSARILEGKADRESLVSATSGADGKFRLDVDRPVVEIVATAEGRTVWSTDAANGDDAGPILLEKAQPYQGRVTADGKPVAGAIVIVGVSTTRSASDGTFSVPLPIGSRARPVVVHPDYAPLEPSFAGDRVSELKLTRGVAVRGRVMAPDGRTPIPHAVVIIDSFSKVESAADGSFVIPHASPSWRMIRVTAPGGIAVATRSGAAAYDLRLRPAATISGSIRESRTKAPIGGMRLTLWSGEEGRAGAITDAKGLFSFTDLPPGNHRILAGHPAYQLESSVGTLVSVAQGEAKTLNVTAIPLTQIRGSVIDEDRKPVGAAIVAAPGNQDVARSAVTNGKGEFAIRIASTTGSMLMARKEGFIPSTTTAEQSLHSPVITLRRGFPLTATVIDEEKKPVAKASIFLSSTEAAEDGVARSMNFRCGDGPCLTGDDGKVEIRLAPGTYAVQVSGLTIVAKNFPPQKLTEKSAPLTLAVQRGSTISGRVVYSDGSPATEALVALSAADPSIHTMTPVDTAGAFSIANSPRGPVTLRVQVSGGGDVGQQFPGKEVTAPAKDVLLTMPPSGRVSGNVLDSSTRQPITEFQITTRRIAASRPATFNANDGSFTIDHVAAGKIDITASAAGYVRGSVSDVEVTDGKTTSNVEIRLDPAARVTGRVTATGGAPLAGVYVTTGESGARGRMGTVADSATTDSDGEFKLDSVPPGDRRLSFMKQGYVQQEKAVEAVAAKEAHVDVVMDRGLELRGRVVDESGQGVANANIGVQAPGGGGNARTEADGTFSVAGLRDLHYTVFARKQGYAEARLDDVVPATAGPQTLTLRRGATVNGHVSNIPAGAAQVTVNMSGDRVFNNGRVDPSTGTFTVTGLPDGNFSAEASAFIPGSGPRRTGRVQVSVTNGTSAPVELAFPEGVTIQGRVTMSGKPAGGMHVTFFSALPALPSGNAMSAADGTYSIAGLSAGDYRVTVSAPGGNNVFADTYTVSSTAVYDIDIHSASLRGRITDADSGAPLASAQVSVMSLESKPMYVRPETTDLDGGYGFDGIAEGKWRVTVQKDGYQSFTREVVIVGPSTADAQLSRAAKTTVHLIDASDGRPVVGTVSVYDTAKKPVMSATAHADGSADLWLAPGAYTVFASAQQYYADPTAVTAPGADVQIPMRRAGRVVLRWTRQGVVAVRLTSVNPRMTLRTNGSSFESVRPGAWVAQLLGPDNKPLAEQPVNVSAGQTATVVFP